jgi:hypothetical protein
VASAAPVLAVAAATPGQQVSYLGPLRLCPANPRYFADPTGRPVVLTGSHTWPSLVDMGPSDPPPAFDYTGYLDFLERHHHNFIRLWTWESTTWDTAGNQQKTRHYVAPLAWARTGPGTALDGKPRFDLTAHDPEFFRRLRRRVESARQRGLYVSVMLFEGWAMQHAPGAWESHPFHPANNIQELDPDVNRDRRGLEVHTLSVPRVTRLQEAYVRKVIDTVNDLDNVLYEISNENHPPSTDWQYHLIRFIREVERGLPKQHPIGMTFQYKGGSNDTLFASPADWISPNPEGGYRDNPPPADGRKVILTDTDHLWGLGGNVPWAWKSFLQGMNPLFMDPYDSVVLESGRPSEWEPLRRNLGLIRKLSEQVPLASLIPRPDLASSGYCLAGRHEDRPFLVVWAPKDLTEPKLDLSDLPGNLELASLDTQSGGITRHAPVRGGQANTLIPRLTPQPQDLVLTLTPS